MIVPGANNWFNNGSIASFGVASVVDGTSNTAMYSERLIGLLNNPQILANSTNKKRGLFATNVKLNIDANDGTSTQTFVAACQSIAGTTVAGAQTSCAGALWHTEMAYETTNISYHHFMTPNSLSCSATNSEDVNGGGGVASAITANSNHPGGINVCFGDGSVKFIKDAVNMQTWWALGTRSGSETISSDSY